LPILEQLVNDKVVNVRISISELIAKHIKKQGVMSKNPRILKIKDILLQDKHADVRHPLE